MAWTVEKILEKQSSEDLTASKEKYYNLFENNQSNITLEDVKYQLCSMIKNASNVASDFQNELEKIKYVYILRFSPFIRLKEIFRKCVKEKFGETFVDLLKIFHIEISDNPLIQYSDKIGSDIMEHLCQGKTNANLNIFDHVCFALKNIMEQEYTEDKLLTKSSLNNMNPAIEIICLGEFKSAEAEIIHDLCLKVLTNLTMIPTNYELIGKVIADFAEEKLKLAAKLIKMAIKNEPKIYCNPFKAFTDFKNPENFNIEEANWIAKKLSKIDNDEKEETHICNYQNWCKFYSESIPIKFESIAFRCHKMLQNEEFKKCHSNGFSCFLQNIKDFSNLENDLKRLLKDPSPNILNRAGYVYENVYILCFSKNVTENTVREFAKERREYCNKGKVDKNDMELLRIAYVGTCGFYGDDVVPRRLINHCENAMSVVGFEDISAKSAFIHAACTDILEQKYGNRKRENIDFSQSNNIDPSIEMICLGNFKKADAARLEFLCTVALNMVSLCHASLYHNSNLGDFIKDFDEKEQIEIAVKLIKYGLKHGKRFEINPLQFFKNPRFHDTITYAIHKDDDGFFNNCDLNCELLKELKLMPCFADTTILNKKVFNLAKEFKTTVMPEYRNYDTGESSVKWYPVKSALFEYLEEILIEHPEDEKCDKVWDSWTTEEDDNDLPAKKRRDV